MSGPPAKSELSWISDVDMQLFLCTWDYQTGQDKGLPAPQDLVKKSPMFCSVFHWNWMIPKAMHCQRLGLVAFRD